jgi:hypothetical protein
MSGSKKKVRKLGAKIEKKKPYNQLNSIKLRKPTIHPILRRAAEW